MTPDQIPQLIAEIALADPRIMRTDPMERRAQVAMWAGILADVPYDFAAKAVHRHYAESTYPILPAEITNQWKAEVSNRLSNFVYEDDPDETPQQYLARLRQQIADTAAGRRPPAPESASPLLSSAPRPIAELLEGIGREVPDEDVPARGPLSAECPRCGSGPLRACKTPNGRRMEIFHPARIDAARGGRAVDADAEQAEVERRRQASRRALADLPPGTTPEPQDGFQADDPGEAS